MAVRGSLIVSFVEMMYFSGSSTATPSLTSSGPKVKLCTTPSSMYFCPSPAAYVPRGRAINVPSRITRSWSRLDAASR